MIRRRGLVSTWVAALLARGGVARAETWPVPDRVFTMADGFVLPARVWRPGAGVGVRGVMLALHGFTDSRDAWALPAAVFAAAGWVVVAPDQRGFGATADRGQWAGAAVMIDDAAAMAATLRQEHPGQRLVVIGESMGGAIALCLATRAPATADAYVLSAPAVWGPSQMPPALRATLWTANRVAPGWRFTGADAPLDITASDNFEALQAYARNPLTLRGATVGMLAGLVALMGQAQDAAPHLPPNVLVLAGRRDQVVPLAATAQFWAKLPRHVRRAFYLNGFHLLLRDVGRALVEADILAWLDTPDAYLPSGADINAASWVADHGWEAQVSGLLPADLLDGYGQRRIWPY